MKRTITITFALLAIACGDLDTKNPSADPDAIAIVDASNDQRLRAFNVFGLSGAEYSAANHVCDYAPDAPHGFWQLSAERTAAVFVVVCEPPAPVDPNAVLPRQMPDGAACALTWCDRLNGF